MPPVVHVTVYVLRTAGQDCNYQGSTTTTLTSGVKDGPGKGPGDDGVPGVLLLAQVHQRAVAGAESHAPRGEGGG